MRKRKFGWNQSGCCRVIGGNMKVKRNWQQEDKSKAAKLLIKTADDFRALHDKLFKLNYLAGSTNNPILKKKISDLQAIVREALAIIRE
jgi:hypothetical protein